MQTKSAETLRESRVRRLTIAAPRRIRARKRIECQAMMVAVFDPRLRAALRKGDFSMSRNGKAHLSNGSRTKAKPGREAQNHQVAKSEIELPPDYRPSEDEPFMNERQRAYFRRKLLAWKAEILAQTRETLQGLHDDTTQHPDLTDRATSESDKALELRARDRQRKLIAKIDAALARIDDGTYGYCEETGEPIGLRRLEARPIATLSIEAQERHERRERIFRDD